MYGPRKETTFADCHLDGLSLYLLKSLGVRTCGGCLVSALEANDPQEKHVVCSLQLSEVVLVEGPSYEPKQQGLHHLGL